MAGVADQHDGVAVRGVAAGLHVHLRDERARRVDHVVRPLPPRPRARRRHAVRGEDDRRAGRRLVLGLDEDGAARLEVAHDVDVVHDLLAHVDGRAVVLERELDRLDRPFDPGAVAAREREQDARDHACIVAPSVRAARVDNSPVALGGRCDGAIAVLAAARHAR